VSGVVINGLSHFIIASSDQLLSQARILFSMALRSHSQPCRICLPCSLSFERRVVGLGARRAANHVLPLMLVLDGHTASVHAVEYTTL